MTTAKTVTKATVRRWVRDGKAREVGTCVSDGRRWGVVEHTERQQTVHYKIERA